MMAISTGGLRPSSTAPTGSDILGGVRAPAKRAVPLGCLLVVALGVAACRPGSGVPSPKAADPAPGGGWPGTRRDDVVEVIHGTPVADPYRWLERAEEPEVKAWMAAQDDLARRNLESLPGRDGLAARLRHLIYADSVSTPVRRGDRFFYTRSRSSTEKAVLYRRDGDNGPETLIIDPNALSPDGSVSLRGWSPSRDGRLLAYKLSKNNADDATLHVRDVDAGTDRERDTIPGAKYASASWTPDAGGFYYTGLPTDPAIAVDERPGRAEIRFHALGTDPASDPVVRPATGDPTTFVGADVSRDGRWLVYWVAHGDRRTDVWFQDRTVAGAAFRPLTGGADAVYFVEPWMDRFYVLTSEGAAHYRLFRVDPAKPERSAWEEIVAEREATLSNMAIVGGRLVLVYLHNAVNEVEIRDLDGKQARAVELPGLGAVSDVTGEPDRDDLYLRFESFTERAVVLAAGAGSGTTRVWATTEPRVDLSGMVTEQVWYPSRDGTRVSMFLVHGRRLRRTSDNPVLLYGYGGFGISLTPWFSSMAVAWLEHGGVFAVPNLRGGGEYGEEWHRAGMLDRKQNVFDDFIGAAEYLIAGKLTRPERLAIWGASNGGLLVGAAMTQRPDLFRAVVCEVPLLDMVRYHRFGSGATWIEEYGSSDDPAQFKALYAYSPYHHVSQRTTYPAVLMMSADSDDRVDPMHARKFVAAVQWAAPGRPVWLRIEKNAGHGGADVRKVAVEHSTDALAFVLNQLGIAP
jgi:prolyl oligopeptidase